MTESEKILAEKIQRYERAVAVALEGLGELIDHTPLSSDACTAQAEEIVSRIAEVLRGENDGIPGTAE